MLKKIKSKALFNSLVSLQQRPFNAGSATGFSDDESDWLGGSALMAGIYSSTMVSRHLKRATVFATELLKTNKNSPKIVWVVLHGALDSLHTIVPTVDPQYKKLRRKLSLPFKTTLLPLKKGFALYPALKNMHNWYQEKSMLPIVTASSGYSHRSHFDMQDFLECGKGEIDHDIGWR
jgi:uncharacterized protein (DUF1501 family)